MSPEEVISKLEEHFSGVIQQGNEYVVDCPFCGDKKQNLSINPYRMLVHCWRCNYGSNVWGLFKRCGIPFFIKEDTSFVGFKKGILSGNLYNMKDDNMSKKVMLPRGSIQLWKNWHNPQYYEVVQYLKNRNVSYYDVMSYNIYYTDDGIYTRRVIVPIYDNGVLVCFVARTIDSDNKKKYLNASGVKLKKVGILFNIDMAFNFNPIILTEGVFDAIAVGDDAVALLGTSMTHEQINRIVDLHKDVIVCLDGDARPHTYDYAKSLYDNGVNVRICVLPRNEDPSSLGVTDKTVKETFTDKEHKFARQKRDNRVDEYKLDRWKVIKENITNPLNKEYNLIATKKVKVVREYIDTAKEFDPMLDIYLKLGDI